MELAQVPAREVEVPLGHGRGCVAEDALQRDGIPIVVALPQQPGDGEGVAECVGRDPASLDSGLLAVDRRSVGEGVRGERFAELVDKDEITRGGVIPGLACCATPPPPMVCRPWNCGDITGPLVKTGDVCA